MVTGTQSLKVRPEGALAVVELDCIHHVVEIVRVGRPKVTWFLVRPSDSPPSAMQALILYQRNSA